MRAGVRADYEAALRVVGSDDDAFAVRFESLFTGSRQPLVALYGDDPRFADAWRRLLGAIAATAAARSRELRMLDHEREVTPDWLQREQAVGYVTYVDRFAGTLTGVRERLPYLRELGVTYLHLMPLLAARPAPNDGGYAVVDYGAVAPVLGTMDDLRALASDLRGHGMALCIDVVLNHVAAEHPWARDPAFLRTFPDRTEPDAYERTVPDVFPDSHRARSRGARSTRAGSGRRSTPTNGTSTTRTRTCSWRWPRPCSGSRRWASTCCVWTPRRFCGSGSAPTARTSPRSTSCCRPSGRPCGSPRPPWPSRPRRSSPPAT